MHIVSRIDREMAVAAFGSIWLAEDLTRRLCEHLGSVAPALHFGESFPTLADAQAARPADYQVVRLGDRIALPAITPIPRPRHAESRSSIPHEVYVFEFDDLLAKGLRVVPAQIVRIEFDFPPSHLMGSYDFVASAVAAGPRGEFRVTFDYDDTGLIRIVENPQVWGERGYAVSGQCMAFFTEAEAVHEADRFAQTLIEAADWRGRAERVARAA